MTVRQALILSLTGCAQNHGPEEVAPAASLWTDKAGLWGAVAPNLQLEMPSLVRFGEYAPESKTGPAIWIRCLLAGGLNTAATGAAVVYLPGVGRGDLHNAEEAPRPLQPLIELQYRGALWADPNGRDWTPAAFLGSLGLDVASDEATRSAIQERLPRLLSSDINDLKALGRLDSVKIRNLGSDWPSAILAWMEKPTERGEDWDAFRAACKTQYSFDPQADGELAAAELLAQAGGGWAAVWSRFAHAPHRYPGTVRLLRGVVPPTGEGLFKPRQEGYPKLNLDAEANLRTELAKVAKKDSAIVRKRILELEAEHGGRRGWVWRELRESPLASCLEFLAQCAKSTGTALGATSVEELMSRYAKLGWQADQSGWKAYAAVDSTDAKLVGELLQAIYLPWLHNCAEVFTKLCQKSPLKSLWRQIPDPAPGECLLFADGLRFDVAKMLEEELSSKNEEVELKHRVSGLPSVTPTAKPAVSPISDQFGGTESGAEFQPIIIATGKPLTIDAFRDLLQAKEIQVLGIDDLGDPQGCGWTEAGSIDKLGHNEGARLAKRIPEEVKLLCERVRALLDAGWRTVRVITDHGWLWMPGGLPKAALPAYLAESRWGRCAVLKDNATTDLNTAPWHYNPNVAIAVPAGVSCFRAGTEYSHGGLSVQECVIPDLTVTRKVEAVSAVIELVNWTGLRCKVKVTESSGLQVDIRTKPAESNTSVAGGVKALDAEGKATILVTDDYEGLAVVVVLIDEAGRVVAKAPTTVGGAE